MLEILGDGEWHSIGEVRKEMGLSAKQFKQVTDFFSQYEFITVDNSKKRMRVKEDVRSFLLQSATS
jgi:hypothetical protein